MRRILIAVILALAIPLEAQAQQNNVSCASGATVAPDDLIKACTDYIQAGGKTEAQLAAAYNNRGLGYRAKHLLDPAIADFTQAVSLKADYSEAYFNRGLSYGQKGLIDQAIADFSKVITLTPNFSTAYSVRGYSYEQKKQFNLALADYRAAVKINPIDNVALQGLKRLGAP
jgi:tetratricopeptide (TPR) repeat protein